jgi:hypothetical protein
MTQVGVEPGESFVNRTNHAPSNGTESRTAAPSDNHGGQDSFTDELSLNPHPKHRVAQSVTSILRTVALFLLVGGVAGAIVWRFDFRQPGPLQGSASGVVLSTMIGLTIVAALLAVLAFVVDLRFRIDWDAKCVPARRDEWP